MKHVFSVSSHLVFYIARRIIEKKGIPVDDCALFLVRNYRVPDKYTTIYKHQIHTSYNITPDKGRVFAGIHVLKTLGNIRHFDNLVDEHIQGEDFIFYTPVCSNDISSLMVTKSNCKGYYITEDGFTSYRNYNPQTFNGLKFVAYKLVLNIFFHRIFAIKNHFITTNHPKFIGCIATDKRCFPLHQEYISVIGFPFEKEKLDISPDAIVSIDPLFLFVGIDVVKRVYVRLANFMKSKSYKVIAYKMHPRFNAVGMEELCRQYKEIFEGQFPQKIVELQPDVVLENVLSCYKCDFYSCNSAISIYASQAGAHCYSIMPLLKGTPAYETNKFIESCNIQIE